MSKTPTVHELKTVQPFFKAVWEGKKTAELRKNDRGFMINDIVILKEYNPHFDTVGSPISPFSGCEVWGIITSVIYKHESLTEGYCMFSFKEINRINP